MRVLGYLYRPCYRYSAAWLLPCSARPSMQPPQPSRWRCGAGIRDPVYRRCATSSTHSCTALRRSAVSGIGPLALAAALSSLAAAPAARQRLSRTRQRANSKNQSSAAAGSIPTAAAAASDVERLPV